MNSLEELTGAPNIGAVPGHTLSPFRISDFALCQAEFKRRHRVDAAVAGAAADDAMVAAGFPSKRPGKDICDRAERDIVNGVFNWGRAGFDANCFSAESLPFLLWVCLRITEPAITQAEAEKIITKDNENAVHLALMKCMGFEFAKKAPAAGGKPQTDNPPTGANSSNLSSTSEASSPSESQQ